MIRIPKANTSGRNVNRLIKKAVKFKDVIATFQFIILISATILVCMMCAYMANPIQIYLGSLSASKKRFLKTYKDGKYDFLKNENIEETITKEINRLALWIAKKAYRYFLMYILMVGLNLLNTLLGICGYFRNTDKGVITMAILSLILAVYFFYQLLTLNEKIRQLTLTIINKTHQFDKKISQCSICYKHVTVKANEKDQMMNILALSLNVFACCGMESYIDVMHGTSIPFTCCPRKSYASANLETEAPCDVNNVYGGCYKKLLQFMIHKTMFFSVKFFLSVLLIFNLLFSLPTLSKHFACCKSSSSKRKPMTPPIIKDIKQMKKRPNIRKMSDPFSEASTLYGLTSLLTSLSISKSHDDVVATFNDKEYLLEHKITSESSSESTSISQTNLIIHKDKINQNSEDKMCATDKMCSFNEMLNLAANCISSGSTSQLESSPNSSLRYLKDDIHVYKKAMPFNQVTLSIKEISELKDKIFGLNHYNPFEPKQHTILTLQSLKDEINKFPKNVLIKSSLTDSKVEKPSLNQKRKNSLPCSISGSSSLTLTTKKPSLHSIVEKNSTIKDSSFDPAINKLDQNVEMSSLIPQIQNPLLDSNIKKTLSVPNVNTSLDQKIKSSSVIPKIQKPSLDSNMKNVNTSLDQKMKSSPVIPQIQNPSLDSNIKNVNTSLDQKMKSSSVIPQIQNPSLDSNMKNVNTSLDQKMKSSSVIPHIQNPSLDSNMKNVNTSLDQKMKSSSVIPKMKKPSKKPNASKISSDSVKKNNSLHLNPEKPLKQNLKKSSTTPNPNPKMKSEKISTHPNPKLSSFGKNKKIS